MSTWIILLLLRAGEGPGPGPEPEVDGHYVVQGSRYLLEGGAFVVQGEPQAMEPHAPLSESGQPGSSCVVDVASSTSVVPASNSYAVVK